MADLAPEPDQPPDDPDAAVHPDDADADAVSTDDLLARELGAQMIEETHTPDERRQSAMTQNPFDALGGGGLDLNALMQQAQQMQEQLQSAQARQDARPSRAPSPAEP